MRDAVLKAPFPYFGGKSSVADEVWRRFGQVPNYIEPFFGSGATLLRRPPHTFPAGCDRETVNDFDAHVANFWRATKHAPEAAAAAADRIVHELDLHAIGDALFCRPCKLWPLSPQEFVAWIRADESHFDAEIAGCWAWFLSNWIGGLPNTSGDSGHKNEAGTHRSRPHLGDAGKGVSRQMPHLGNAGKGVSRKIPHLGDAGMGVSRKIPHLGDAGKGECARRREVLVEWFSRLADRLRNVRVCCGDWSRICGPSVTNCDAATCAVFLDPPYSAEAGRDNQLYSTECGRVAHDVREWCLAAGCNKNMRIALCGYEGEHESLQSSGWSVFAWKTQGGYANSGNSDRAANRGRERIWFSPACLCGSDAPTLFDLESEK